MYQTLRHALIVVLFASAGARAAEPPSADFAKFARGIELVQSYKGNGDELARAMQLADELSKSSPRSGYSEVLVAEALSTWRLDQKGEPAEVREEVLRGADQALKLNPRLAHAFVAKGRALVRWSKYPEAQAAIDSALAINPNLSGAIFLRADVFRRMNAYDSAETWFLKFIESTDNVNRKSAGYSWIGEMYRAATYNDPTNRPSHIARGRAAYEKALSLEATSPWRTVNFAIFLNDYAADFDGAERFALKALSIMEFPMARYHLAAARYQKIGLRVGTMSPKELGSAVQQVAASTKVTLADAVAFQSFTGVVSDRLMAIQMRLQ